METEFKPVFLWRPSPKFSFESQLNFTAGVGRKISNTSTFNTAKSHSHRIARSFSALLRNESTPVSENTTTTNQIAADILLKYSSLTYICTPNLSVTAGLFLSSFGMYSEQLYSELTNKFLSAPYGFGYNFQSTPETELGIQVRGNLKLKSSGIKYALGISNGPALIESGTNAGQLDYENLADNNSNKAISARIGFLPWNNRTFEIGLSSRSAKVGESGSALEGVDSRLLSADISVSKNFNSIKGMVELKIQYTYISLDNVYYNANPLLTLNVPAKDVNLKDSTYRFDNKSELYFISLGFRPTTDNKFFKNFEYVFRYDVLNLPVFALWGKDKTRFTGGFLYWLSENSCLKLSYEYETEEKFLVVQWVMGF